MAAKPAIFVPVLQLPGARSLTDDRAEKLVHAIHGQVHATMKTARNAKQQLGVSEIGDPCDKTIARRLAMLEPKDGESSWKAQVGTFIHDGLERHFSNLEVAEAIRVELGAASVEIVCEAYLPIWQYGSLDLGGSCDMLVRVTFADGSQITVVVDWKTQGIEKLQKKTAKGDIGQTYTVQMHTYGLGYELQGYQPTHVLLYALPRDAEVDEAKPVLMRYDRSIAVNAIARLQTFIDKAAQVGWQTTIEEAPRAGFCFDCNRYEATHQGDFLTDLLAGQA